mmetsp:Transcript_23582/g.48826  ORF Transcript_23582/g.48826 Transcript_23582/m.48826 type:complete len:330 (+) Transcript_23582:2-991(+)
MAGVWGVYTVVLGRVALLVLKKKSHDVCCDADIDSCQNAPRILRPLFPIIFGCVCDCFDVRESNYPSHSYKYTQTGMHNEFVGTRAPRAAAFVCFKAAEEGGEFLIADGRAMFRDLNPDLVERLYDRSIRYSVMELPFFGWIDGLPEAMQGPFMGGIKGLASAAINAKVDFSVDLRWGEAGYDNTRMLQARAPSQPPIVRHPVTGEPTWFCNVHSHSSKLRKDREGKYGAERFEDGASQINKSDMFFGDDGDISDEDLVHMDEVTMKNVKFVKMTEGDVVLLDNYKCMHGRNVFDGTRKHGVAWFADWEGSDAQQGQAKPLEEQIKQVA